MPILQRDDGVDFVLQPYREKITIKNTRLLKKEVQYLSETHGAYARFFPLEQGGCNIVLSHEVGYLVGEMIYAHFHHPKDFIYCEILDPTEKLALLVIAHDGQVYLDAKLSFDEILNEVEETFELTDSRFDIFVDPELPIDFDQKLVSTLNKLTQPVFIQLKKNSAFELLPLPLALKEQQSLWQSCPLLASVAGVCLLSLLAVFWYEATVTPSLVVAQSNPIPANASLSSLTQPSQQIADLLQGLFVIDELPGWAPSAIHLNAGVVTVDLFSLGGSADRLLENVKQEQMLVDFGDKGETIRFDIRQDDVSPDTSMRLQKTIATVIDRMSLILPNANAVKIMHNPVIEGNNQEIISIQFSKISPEVLQLVGANLDDLPVRVKNMSAKIKNGLFSGSLQLVVVGN